MNQPQDQANELLTNSEILLEALPPSSSLHGEIVATRSRTMRVVYENNDFSVSTTHTNTQYGVRAIMDGKLGFMTTNANDPERLREVAQETKQVAEFSIPSEHHQIASEQSNPEYFEAYDEDLSALHAEGLCKLAEQVVNEATQDPKVAIERVEAECTVKTDTVANSNGVRQAVTSSDFSWFGMGSGRDGDDITSFDYDGASVIRFSEIDKRVEETMRRLRESLVGSLGARPGKSYKGRVLLHPIAVVDLLGGLLETNCNAKNHQDGISAWQGLVGDSVASNILNVYEDPQNQQRASGWLPFDREGVHTQRHDLLIEGVLSFLAHNCFSAHREGVAPTGNANGNARSLPRTGFSNLTFEGVAGQTVDEALLPTQLNTGLVLKRFSGNNDSISGQFSGVAKNSWWIENGQRTHAVHEIMVSGNVFDLLKQIVSIGSQPHRLIGDIVAPYILVDGVSVTAG